MILIILKYQVYVRGVPSETEMNTTTINNLDPGTVYNVEVYSKSHDLKSLAPASGTAYTSNIYLFLFT